MGGYSGGYEHPISPLAATPPSPYQIGLRAVLQTSGDGEGTARGVRAAISISRSDMSGGTGNGGADDN
mgnify:CR=1 FL=1